MLFHNRGRLCGFSAGIQSPFGAGIHGANYDFDARLGRGRLRQAITEAKQVEALQVPRIEESVGRSNYYIWALSAIKHHHRGDTEFVDETLHRLHEEAVTESDPRRRAKLRGNHRAITDYLNHFGDLNSDPARHPLVLQLSQPHRERSPRLGGEEGPASSHQAELLQGRSAGGVTATLLHVLYESAR